ncbi:MAG: tetratricopeptide repeat protein [Myxococcota bacterium]|nr:tetratricopeptide repeat protein [Myxococcota bacterium]
MRPRGGAVTSQSAHGLCESKGPKKESMALGQGFLSRLKRPLCVCLFVCLCALTACSSKRFEFVWSDRYIEAARLHDQERYTEASEHYAQLLKHAPDEEKKRLILYRMALMQEQQGEVDAALESYTEIYEDERADEYGSRALRASILIYRERGDQARARELTLATVDKYPESIAAEHALRDIRKWHREEGRAAEMVEYLLATSSAHKGTEIEDFALMMRGEVFEEDLSQDEDAIGAYEKVIELAYQGKLADDAIWRIAQIHIRNKRWDKALEYLDRLVAEHHEKSWFIGDYNSEFADEARLESGRIYLEELEDYDAAIVQFEKFIKEFPNSRLKDDAAWEVVKAIELKGDASATREAMEDFIKDYPESRYVRVARARLGANDGAGNTP